MSKYKPPSKIAARTYSALQLLDMTILTEYNVGGRLRLDFLVREMMLGVEVDGDQHEEFNGHFFAGKDEFRDARMRDQTKKVACEELGITLVRLNTMEVMGAPSAELLLKLILTKLNDQREEAKEDIW